MKKILKLIMLNAILLIIYNILPTIKIDKYKTQQISGNLINLETNEKNIKNYNLTTDMDLRTISNLEAKDYETMLSNTNLKGLGSAFKKAEEEYNVNGLYLVGLCCLESSYGNSNYAVNRNNLVGWNAVDSNPNKASYFNSKEECIEYVAKKLNQNYLSENGKYFNGYSARSVDVKYCSDKSHADKIVNIVKKLIKRLEV